MLSNEPCGVRRLGTHLPAAPRTSERISLHGVFGTLLADRPDAGGQGAHPHPLILAMVRVGMIGGSA